MGNVLYVACRSPKEPDRKWGTVGRLDRDLGHYRFVYTRGAKTLEGFTPFAGMGNLREVYESDELLPLFRNRLMTKRRPEYAEYLEWSGFESGYPPEPMALLAVTEGIRATDYVEVFPRPRPDADNRYRLKFFLHGLQHVPKAALTEIGRLQPGESRGFMLDVSNWNDEWAVAIRTCPDAKRCRQRFQIGYLPRYLARDIHGLYRAGTARQIALTVARVNSEATLQQYLLCQVDAVWPESFNPCSGPEFTPLVDEAELVGA
jgi:hypothetical protein